MPTQTDPIVFAIANHKASLARFLEPRPEGAIDNLARQEVAAFEALARTEPTTKEGLLVLLRYINASDPSDIHESYPELLKTFTRAAEKILAH